MVLFGDISIVHRWYSWGTTIMILPWWCFPWTQDGDGNSWAATRWDQLQLGRLDVDKNRGHDVTSVVAMKNIIGDLLYPLVIIITDWKITMSDINYRWPFSIAMLNYQRVIWEMMFRGPKMMWIPRHHGGWNTGSYARWCPRELNRKVGGV